ncbi:hypothetical protein K2173_018775 [Erythroxylum novogranatense]|uniref:Epidermal patterning factor-like protein n=1 Tax=Erythroxylum novogranatense TaxID=1862640 RepID=A0AAV8SB74_9ROSI|nr:hypothetical protein K2173_018775 [Erythroxylum novogranatense]
MKGSICIAVLLISLLLPSFISARHISRPRTRHGLHHSPQMPTVTRDGMVTNPTLFRERRKNKGPDTVQVAGSSMPDCSHACGSCSPCRLVMVSFVCASLEEAETCPIAYKCMCKNKSYPVP